MDYFVNIYIFLTILLSLNASPYSKSFGIIPIPIEENGPNEEKQIGIPTVKDVSAMCSAVGGIHASIEFDRPFSGRIYSLGFGNVHECVFFNGYYTKRVLFTIPANNCGTHITHNTREVVDLIENRVYVQIDKFTLTAFDRKYAFVCELGTNFSTKTTTISSISSTSNVNEHEIRRRPISPINNLWDKNIFQATSMTPIIPQNLPLKNTKTAMPALLFYGSQQWKIPPENINFKPINNNLLIKLKTDENPTVIMPFSAKNNTNSKFENFSVSNIEQRRKEKNLAKQFSSNSLSDSNLLLNLTTIEYNVNPNKIRQNQNNNTFKSIVSLFKTSTQLPFSEPMPEFITVIEPCNNQNQSNNTSKEITSFIAGSPSISSELNKSIYLEIKRGTENPSNSKRIDGSVRIGEPIMLVVHAKTISKDLNQYNIFVHSCYSSGGSETTRIKLIDNLGCAIHPQVIGSMKREHILLPNENDNKFNAEIIYYFAMKAFKFPTGDDVHFFCSVDISPDYNFPELCLKSPLIPRKVRRVVSTETDSLSFENNNSLEINNEKIFPKIQELKVFNSTFVADDLTRSNKFIKIKGTIDEVSLNNNRINWTQFKLSTLIILSVIVVGLITFIILCIIYIFCANSKWRKKSKSTFLRLSRIN